MALHSRFRLLFASLPLCLFDLLWLALFLFFHAGLVTFRPSLAGRALAPSPRPFGESLQYSQTGERKELGLKPSNSFSLFSPVCCVLRTRGSIGARTHPARLRRESEVTGVSTLPAGRTMRLFAHRRLSERSNGQRQADGEPLSPHPSVPLGGVVWGMPCGRLSHKNQRAKSRMVGVRPGCTNYSPLCDGLSQGIPHSATPGQPKKSGKAKKQKQQK
jgi:hypothetical protein